MRCNRCGVCCQETDMLLCSADIARLEKQGYSKASFVRFDQEGYALLRNRQGHCVFYNPQACRCDVYASRPFGCRVYPVILDEGNRVIVDAICHAQETISEEEKARRGEVVRKLLEQIDEEAARRRKVNSF
ncbi:MAG: YkgJ family cysteine cluster protein [Candidatus Bathyarchaeia archaeon]